MGREIIAYQVTSAPALEIEPAPALRAWMSLTHEGFANRCLPLLIANQAGWMVLGSQTVRVIWAGGARPSDLEIERLEGVGPDYAASHFGHGILTFSLPYLFRTPPGWNLLVRGPANLPKDGIAPLDGIVETDWSPATFTMNWKLTRPAWPVTFERGEPIAMLVPVRRGELEAFAPEVRALDDDPATARAYRAWRASRSQFLRDLRQPGTEAHEQAWQKDYLHGRGPGGTKAAEHQRKLTLRPFRRKLP